ncbi:MAG TPA: superoxide dismutase [Burkholderiales bacterium]|nr:superoxide dismutase [Burkholderiales bacterium]
MSATAAGAQKAPQFELPPLPYAEDALAPVISAETLRLHHGKHHRKYVDTMNQLLQQNPVQGTTLEEIVRAASGKLFNNAGQVWNHNFYWQSLSPKPTRPEGQVLQKINDAFGGYETFAKKFAEAASGQFGSGWAWLVEKDGKLQIMTTPNAETPMTQGYRCLLTVDVWEHAYYVDYRNERDKYLNAVINERLNWAFAQANLGKG